MRLVAGVDFTRGQNNAYTLQSLKTVFNNSKCFPSLGSPSLTPFIFLTISTRELFRKKKIKNKIHSSILNILVSEDDYVDLLTFLKKDCYFITKFYVSF